MSLPFAGGVAQAQTWSNGAGGNFSLGSNWVGGTAPVSGSATALIFGDLPIATLSYTATNNISPFDLNSIVFNNNGASVVTIAGSLLNFTGTAPAINMTGTGSAVISAPVNFDAVTTIGGAGTGTLTMSGAITTPSGAAAPGALVINSAGTVVLTGGGTFNDGATAGTGGYVSVTGGTLRVTAGTYTANFAGTATDLAGLQIGSLTGAPAAFQISGGATFTAPNIFFGRLENSKAAGTIDGFGTSLISLGQFTVGSRAGVVATLDITNGGVASGGSMSNGLTAPTGTAPAPGTGTINVIGMDALGNRSTYRSTTTSIIVGQSGTATLNVTAGGLATSFTTTTIASAAGGVGTINISGTSGGATPVPSSLIVGSSMTVGSIGQGTLNITGGGTVTATTNIFTGSGSATAQGNINVSGNSGGGTPTPSTLFVTNQFTIGGGTATPGAGIASVSSGGFINVGGNTIINQQALALPSSLTVSGAGTLYTGGTNQAASATSLSMAFGTSVFTVQQGARATFRWNAFIASNLDAVATVNVTGTSGGPAPVASSLAIGNQMTVGGGGGTASPGRGNLNITGGGQVTVAGLTIVNQDAASIVTSTITVSDAGSSYVATGALSMRFGTTIFNAKLGATATVGGTTVIGTAATSNSTLNVTDAGTSFNGALLQVGSTLGGTAALNVNTNGTATLTGALQVFTGGLVTVNAGTVNAGSLLDGTLGTNFGNISLTSTTLTTGSANTSTTYTGIISGNGNLTKLGTGTQTLNGANLYSGTTNINAGTLFVGNTTGSGTGTGAVSVNNGGTLAGTGIITGAVTVNTGGRVTAGAGTNAGQTLTVGSTVFNANSALRVGVEAGAGPTDTTLTGASRIAVTGTFDVSPAVLAGTGPLILELSSPTALTEGVIHTRRVGTYGSLGPVLSPAGPTITLNAGDPRLNVSTTGFQINQTNWSFVISGGNMDFTFTPVPEPASMLLLGGAAFGFAAYRRRRIA